MHRVAFLLIGFSLLCAGEGRTSVAAPELVYTTHGLTVTASWSSVPGATGYKLYYAPFPFLGEQTIGHLDLGSQTSLSVDLWLGAAYYIAVKAVDQQGESGYSNIGLVRFPADPDEWDDDQDGVTENQGDCNDSDPAIHPGAGDPCGDGLDQDCGGINPTCPLTEQLLASGIGFLPQWFLSSNQLRVSLLSDSGSLVFTDASDAPLKKQRLDGSPPIALARRFTAVESVVLHDGSLYWLDAGKLWRLTPAGESFLLATGRRGAGTDVTADLVVDNDFVYWVDQAAAQACSPPCNWEIQRIPLTGGPPVVLATADRRIAALRGDAHHLYWLEESLEPWTTDCACGSKVKTVPKSGGVTTVLVDGSLNGTRPAPPPGSVAGSWLPTGGLALSDTNLVFAAAGNSSYAVKSVPLGGGALRDLATVPSTAGYARNAVLDLTIRGGDLYWLDTANATLDKLSLAGGAVVTLASGLTAPGALAASATTAFWTESGAPVGCCRQMGAGTVRQFPLAGGTVSTFAEGLDMPRLLAVDDVHLVWDEAWRIAVAPLQGGKAATLVSGIASDLPRIAIAQSKIYILDGDLVKVVPLAGGAVEKFASARFGTIGDFSLTNMDIVADTAAVYWTVGGVMGAPIVQKLALTGGVPEIIEHESGIPYPQDCYWRIALDDRYVYWSEGSTIHAIGCAIKRVPLAGGAVTTLVDQPYLADFTVDGRDLYFSEFEGTPSIQRLPREGGAAVTVAGNVAALSLANTTDTLYWLDLQADHLGALSKTAAPGTAPLWLAPVVMDPYLAFDGLYVNQDGIYFSEVLTGTIYRLEEGLRQP